MGWFDWFDDWVDALGDVLRGRQSRFSGQLQSGSTPRFVTDADGKGWMMVKWDHNRSTYPPLPQYLKVNLDKVEGGREHFTVLEGRNQGKTASVRLKSNGTSYLGSGNPPRKPAGNVKFDLTKKLLWYGEQGPVAAKTDPENPLSVGTHVLKIPYESHRELAQAYEKDSPYAATWFHIGKSEDRFLHPGRVSAGCATVTDTKEWTKIYNYLIMARLDTQNVGTIEVVAS